MTEEPLTLDDDRINVLPVVILVIPPEQYAEWMKEQMNWLGVPVREEDEN